jgi:predicted 3-demethylubiquinone-9 3-methyltransferase (glyoxalase superfamily)
MPGSVLTARLRFDTEAEEAASFYVGIFKGSRLGGVHQHTEAGPSRGRLLGRPAVQGGQAHAGA